MNNIINKLINKNIAILGFGKEGMSTYNYIRKHLPNQLITIIDKNTNLLTNHTNMQSDHSINYVLGDNYLDNLNKYDYIIKSPGIKIPYEIENRIDNLLTSQVELALEFYNKQIIGITGTKGKSTTSTLLYNVLKDQNKDCLLLGNVGNPILDYIDDVKKDTILVIEMSSYQLDLVKHSPHISIILNLYEDHLNYHITKEQYHLAKMNILKYQTNEDYFLYQSNNTINNYLTNNYKANLIDLNEEFTIKGNNIYYKNEIAYDSSKERLLLGKHNLTNILFVLRVGILLNLDIDLAIKTINTFKPLEHRMEYVGEYKGIKYYNDSIATIPEATINCMDSISNIDTLIFGGQDRGIDYSKLIHFFNNSNIQNFICMPETGYKLFDKINSHNKYKAETLEEAVKIAKKVAVKGCLLSPSAPSYNMFKNFEEKGNLFKDLVRK